MKAKPQLQAKPDQGKIDPAKGIKKEGSVVKISKTLAEHLKADNSAIMSSVAVKPTPEGVKVVSVDKGSIAQQMGIAPNDTLEQVNGLKIGSTQDMNSIYESLKNSADFDITVLRGGKTETLHYQIR
jgi:general secretion pathway protein C